MKDMSRHVPKGEKMETQKQEGIRGDRVYTRKQAAEMLNCSVRTLKRIEDGGSLPRIQISTRIIGYRGSVLQRYLDEKTR